MLNIEDKKIEPEIKNTKNLIEKNTLYVVATPIGNLSDITIRALDILKKVDFILAEDTRTASKLLNYYKIKNTLISYHSHSSKVRVEQSIAMIKNGESGALISDAGTPCISDPGVTLINLAIEKKIKIVPIGGISAFTSLLSVSGLSTGHTLFVGFLSNKSGSRRNQLKNLKENEHNLIVLYESVHRIISCMEDIVNIFGENTDIVLGRELTKQFEQIVRSKASNILDFFKDGSILIKGEFCILIDNRKSKVCRSNAENKLYKESDYDS